MFSNLNLLFDLYFLINTKTQSGITFIFHPVRLEKIITFTKKDEMETISSVKNRLIDKILATKNKIILDVIDNIFATVQQEEFVSLSEEQVEMLIMSEQDIEYGNIISESELEDNDVKWQG